VALAALPARAGAAREGPRFGVFVQASAPDAEAALAGLRSAFRTAGMEPAVLERAASTDDSAARAALAEFAFERVDVVFALGPDAARLAQETLREPSVVFAAVGYPEALGLPARGNVCGVAGGVPAADIVEWARRSVPTLERLGMVSGTGAEAAALADAVEQAAARAGLAVVRIAPGAEPDESCDAVWLGPGVPVGDADALSRALAGRRVPLLGSCRAHLDAGCSVVLRTEPATQGALAAGLARRILDGAAPDQLGVLHVTRRRTEVNLDAARRLGHEIPLTVVAAADHLVPSFGRRR